MKLVVSIANLTVELGEPGPGRSPGARGFGYPCLLVLALTLGAGCEPSAEGKLASPIDAPPPRHPAMATAPGRTAASPHAHDASDPHSGDLPHNHPPVQSSSSGSSPPAGGLTPDADGRITVGEASFKVPEGWVQEAPTSQFRLTQFRLPRADGDSEDGLVTVSLAGGATRGNVDRWRGQFEEQPEPRVDRREVAGLNVTIVRLAGSFRGMGGAAKANTVMHGVIVEFPASSQNLFFKATGPQSTMERWSSSFTELVDSLLPKS